MIAAFFMVKFFQHINILTFNITFDMGMRILGQHMDDLCLSDATTTSWLVVGSRHSHHIDQCHLGHGGFKIGFKVCRVGAALLHFRGLSVDSSRLKSSAQRMCWSECRLPHSLSPLSGRDGTQCFVLRDTSIEPLRREFILRYSRSSTSEMSPDASGESPSSPLRRVSNACLNSSDTMLT